MILSWQQQQWQQVWQMKLQNHLPHGLIFSGMMGIGKVKFAEYFVQMLLCEHQRTNQQTDLPKHCDTCHACRLVITKAHPDVLWVAPEKENGAITIDQIREASDFIAQSSLMQNQFKIVIISAADQMNLYAANALLKTLEEPAQGSLIILITHQSERLPATVRSRCQFLVFPCPEQKMALTWLRAQDEIKNSDPELLLRIANGAPLAALKLLEDDLFSLRQHVFEAFSPTEDPLQASSKLADESGLRILDFSLSWIEDLLRLQLGEKIEKLVNQDHAQLLLDLKEKTCLNANAQFMQYLLELRKYLCQGINLNKQLMIESMLFKWKKQHDFFS